MGGMTQTHTQTCTDAPTDVHSWHLLQTVDSQTAVTFITVALAVIAR